MRALVAVGALALAAAACGDQRERAPAARLVNLESVAQLRTQFARDVGHPRVLLLLSPT